MRLSNSKTNSKPGPRLAISPGEPAGIGPDICLQVHDTAIRSMHPDRAEAIYFGDPRMFQERATQLGIGLDINTTAEYRQGAFNVHRIDTLSPVCAGKPDPRNAPYVLACLDSALNACMVGDCAALVTGPVNKAAINDAGIPFSGHTEWLAEKTGTEQVVMMLIAGSLRVALATTHLPLRRVPGEITGERLTRVIEITLHSLEHQFGIAQPHLLICGLNPHAGENGHLGIEERDIIIPAITSLQEKGHRLTGPVPADTAFTPQSLRDVDAVLAMYHDQGLPALKMAGFGTAVNVTLGLPVLRTSVDHGTAFSLAGQHQADPGSMMAAVNCALELCSRIVLTA